MRDGELLQPEDLLITPELYGRRARPADLERELAAHRELSELMTVDPMLAIQRFLDLALELCPAAGSAGLSELQDDPSQGSLFAWTAMSGALAGHVGGTTPRDFSPCGLCLDHHHTILVERPARVFTYFREAAPEIVEGLIVPLYDTGKRPLGTLWVVSHDRQAHFDPTDARVMEQLAVQLVLALKLRKKIGIVRQLEEAARDREILIKEVRHRVKNMIQMTSSLLQLQERGVTSGEARTALREAQARLLVLASVYETLLAPQADVRRIDVGPLIEDLVLALRDSNLGGGVVKLCAECDSLMVDIGDAVPLGLIVNEAVTNSLKHAFAPAQGGRITVRLQVDGTACQLAIRDDGKGFGEAVRAGSLGMTLIRSLARQLRAKLTLDGSDGALVALDWTIAPARPRAAGEAPAGAGRVRRRGAGRARDRPSAARAARAGAAPHSRNPNSARAPASCRPAPATSPHRSPKPACLPSCWPRMGPG